MSSPFAPSWGGQQKQQNYQPQTSSGRLIGYVQSVRNAVESSDGKSLAELWKVVDGTFAPMVAQSVEMMNKNIAPFVSKENLPDALEIRGATYHIILCMAASVRGRAGEAFGELLQAANLFLPIFRNWESPWAMSALHGMLYDIRIIAEKADREMASQSLSSSPARSLVTGEKLKAAGSFLMKVFGAIAGKGNKKQGSLFVACQLFKIYFKLGTLNLSKSVIRVIDASKEKGFREFPKRDQVTYMYYTGRMDVFNEDFPKAHYKLLYGLSKCHQSKFGNIRKIVKYFIPVNLSLGVLPRTELIERFRLTEYTSLVMALRRGDLKMFQEAIRENEDKFLQAGTYLVLEKLEILVYRRLFKKLHIILRAKDVNRAHQIKLDLVLKALKWMGIADVDIDEVECISATLIYRGLVKGYFSHKSKVMVLSKQDPFPRLKNLLSSAAAGST